MPAVEVNPRRPRDSTAERSHPESAQAFDPLRYCIFTTIALIAWAVSPPAAVALMSGLGLWAYARAWRAGLRRSRCFLGDVRVVMGYLGAAFALGCVFTGLRLLDLLR